MLQQVINMAAESTSAFISAHHLNYQFIKKKNKKKLQSGLKCCSWRKISFVTTT